MRIETVCNVVHTDESGQDHDLSGIEVFIGDLRYAILEGETHVYTDVYRLGPDELLRVTFEPKQNS